MTKNIRRGKLGGRYLEESDEKDIGREATREKEESDDEYIERKATRDIFRGKRLARYWEGSW